MEAPEPPDEDAAAEALASAQGIRCGALPLAFPYGWARSIEEAADWVALPHAPAWLLGAANVEGQVVPVVDLAAYAAAADRAAPPLSAGRGTSLLVGGSGDELVGFAFHGRPALVRFATGEPDPQARALAPARLAPHVLALGRAEGPADALHAGAFHLVLDPRGLFDALWRDLPPA